MKKILSLVVLLTLAVGSYAADGFFDLNKKDNNKIYSIAAVDNVNKVINSVGVYSDAEANATSLLFPNANIVYRSSDNGQAIRVSCNGAMATYQPDPNNQPTLWEPMSNGQVASGMSYITAINDGEKYVLLYDSIKIVDDNFENYTVNQHSYTVPANLGWGNAITNNGPFLAMQDAKEEAKAAFNNKENTEADYKTAVQTLSLNYEGAKKLFTELELLATAASNLKKYYEETEINGRLVKNYPAAETIMGQHLDNFAIDFTTSQSYAQVNADSAMCKTLTESLEENASNYDDATLELYDRISQPDYNPGEVTSTYGYPAIEKTSYIDYGFYVLTPTQAMIEAGVAFGKECAAWAGSAPFVSYPGIALAGVTFAAKMATNSMLLAANIKTIILLDEVIEWLNTECQDDEAYAYLTDEYHRTRSVLCTATARVATNEQYEILSNGFARAKELSALGVARRTLQDLIYEGEDVYFEMKTNRDNETASGSATKLHQAKKNLRAALTAAQIEKEKNYVEKQVTYNYSENGGEYSLYDWQWYTAAGVQLAGNERPSQIINREITKLQNAIDLYSKQYELEDKLDELLKKITANDLYANPQQILIDAEAEGEEFNVFVSQNKKLIADINAEISKLNDALQLAADNQQTIQDAVDLTQETIDNMVNNLTTDDLTELLEQALEDLDDKTTWAEVLQILQTLTDGRAQQTHDDLPNVYLDDRINDAEAFYEANKALMTPAQTTAYEKAMAAAKIAQAEWYDDRYQDEDQLKRDWLKFRMYCAALALEYIQKMTINATDGTDAANVDKQLEEALVLVAIAAASSYEGDIDAFKEALKEGNAIYRDDNSTDNAKEAAIRNLRGLLGGTTTAISSLNNGKAALKDGKFVENGKLVIVKNGMKFRANGTAF